MVNAIFQIGIFLSETRRIAVTEDCGLYPMIRIRMKWFQSKTVRERNVFERRFTKTTEQNIFRGGTLACKI